MGYPAPPPPRRPPSRPGQVFWLAVVGLPLLLLAAWFAAVTNIGKGVASDRDSLDLPAQPSVAALPSPPPETVATAAPQADPTQPQDVATSSSAVSPATEVQAAETTPPAPATSAPPPEKKELPNVVGMGLQDAQDAMQAAGFWFLRDKDDTGQDRFQIFDRNWVVTRQSPEAGKKVSAASFVTLYAKKKTDP